MDTKQGVARGEDSNIRRFVVWSVNQRHCKRSKLLVSGFSVIPSPAFLRMEEQMHDDGDVDADERARAHSGTHLPLYLWALSNPFLAFLFAETDRSRLVVRSINLDNQYPTMVKASSPYRPERGTE
jgi:hypothetical protein